MAIAIDNLGRKIDTANMTLGEIKSLIGSLMKSKVGVAKPMEGGSTDNTGLQEIKTIFEQYTKDFKDEVQQQRDLLQQVVDNLAVIKDAKSSMTGGGVDTGDKSANLMQGLHDAAKELVSIFGTPGSGYVHDTHAVSELKTINQTLADILQKCCLKEIKTETAANNVIPAETAAPTASSGPIINIRSIKEVDDAMDSILKRTGRLKPELEMNLRILLMMGYTEEQIVDSVEKAERGHQGIRSALKESLRYAKGMLESFNSTFLGLEKGFSPFAGLIDKEREFIIGMDKIAYQMQGITGDTPELQKGFEEIAKSVSRTGVNRTLFQEQYMKLMRRGIRDQKEAQNISIAQLNTEKQTGIEAGRLNDLFGDLAQKGKMSAAEITNLSNGIKQAARNTGLIGEELARAVEGSKPYLDNMMKSGQLNADAAKNIINMQAALQKVGTADAMSGVMNALSSGHNLLFEASSETKALVFSIAGRLGKVQEAMDGTLMKTKEGRRQFAEGMQQELEQIAGVAMEDIDKLSDQQRANISRILKARTGMELAEYTNSTKSLLDASKPLTQRFAEIKDKMKDVNLTQQERIALENQDKKLRIDANADILAALQESTKGAADMDEAFAKFGEKRAGFTDDLQAMGMASMSNADIAKTALQSQLDNLNSELAKAGQAEIKIDSKRLAKAVENPRAFKELQEEFMSGQQRLEAATEAATDPISENTKMLTEVNESLRQLSGSFISSFFKSFFGNLTVFVSMIGALLSTLGIDLITFSMNLGSIRNTMQKYAPQLQKSITGMGAKAATGLAAGFKSIFSTVKKGFTALRGATVAGTLGTAQIVFAVIDGIFGAFRGFANAEKNFKGMYDATKGVSTQMRIAGTVGGALAGILNGLTLGLLGFVGGLDFVEYVLSHLVNIILTVIVAPIQGFIDAFRPLGKVFSTIFNQIGEIFSDIFGLFTPIFGLFGDGKRESAGFLGTITNVIHSVMYFIGNVIGGIFANVIFALAKLFEYALIPIRMFTKGLSIIGSIFWALIKTISGIFTLDFAYIGKVWEEALTYIWDTTVDVMMMIPRYIYNLFVDAFSMIPGAVQAVFSYVVSSIWGAFQFLFVQLPQAIIQAFTFGLQVLFVEIPRFFLDLVTSIGSYIWNGLTSLASSDWFGPIFQPFVDAFQPIIDIFNEVYNAISGLFSAIGSVFSSFWSMFNIFGSGSQEASEQGSMFGGVMNVLGTVIRTISQGIGFLIRIALTPLTVAIRILEYVLSPIIYVVNLLAQGLNWLASVFTSIATTVTNLVSGILAPFQWLYNVLVGNSIVPDMVFDIIKFFAMLPINIMKGLISLPFKIIGFLGDAVYNIFSYLGTAMTDSLWSIMTAIPNAIYNGLYSAASAIGLGWLVERLLGGGGGSGGTEEATNTISTAQTKSTEPTNIDKSLIDSDLKAQTKSTEPTNIDKSLIDSDLKARTGMSKREFEEATNTISTAQTKSTEPTNIDKSLIDSDLKARTGMSKREFEEATNTISTATEKEKPQIKMDQNKGVIGTLFGKVGNIASKIGSAVKGAGGVMAGLFGKTVGNIGSAIGGAIGALGSTIGTAGSAIGGAIGTVGSTLVDGAYSIGNGVWEGTKWLGNKLYEGASAVGNFLLEGGKAVWEGTKWLGNKLYEGASAVGNFLLEGGKAVWEGAKEMGSKVLEGASAVGNFLWEKSGGKALWDSTKQFREQVWEGAKSVGNSLLDGAKWLFGYETDAKAEAAAVSGAEQTIAQATGAETTSAPSTITATTAASQGLAGDIAGSIQAEKKQAQPPSSEVMSPELDTIANEASTQTQQLDELIALMKEMVEQNRGGSDINVGNSNSGPGGGMNKVTQKPARYFRNPTGMVNQLSSRNALNIGLPNV
jgi:phage-related protein